MKMNRIVADGRTNVLHDSTNQQKLDEAVREIMTRYDQEMKTSKTIPRIRLWFRMKKEMREAVERLAPTRGCYFKK